MSKCSCVRKIRIIISNMMLLFYSAFVVTSCSLDIPESTETTTTSISHIQNIIIQNGHISDSNVDGAIITPCFLTYGEFGLIVETDIISDLSSCSSDAENLSSGFNFLVIDAQFISTRQRSVPVNAECFSVYADGEMCERVVADGEETVSLPGGRQIDIKYYFLIPTEYTELSIIHDRVTYPDNIEIQVQENGQFTDEDVRYILDNNEVYDVDNEFIVPIESATSDSFYHSNSANTDYSVELTYDGDYTTCWQDGSDGDALGETLNYQFEACDIYGICIVNGNRIRTDSYLRNNRLESILLSFYLSGDVICETEMWFSDDETIEESCLSLDQSVYCDSISITIQSVYPGTSYSDTGISEVAFYSRRYTDLGVVACSMIVGDRTQIDSSATNDTYDYGTRDNPIVITYENVSSLRPNTFVRITGPVQCLSSSTGQFTIGGGNQTYGLWIAIENSDGTICESIEVPSVNANGYEDEFNAHCPFDVRYYPETIGDTRYCGCTATIEGRYESYLAYVDGDYVEFYRLSSGSRIVDLHFYY